MINTIKIPLTAAVYPTGRRFNLMDILTLVLTIVLMAVSLSLIVIILLQSDRSANMSGAISGGMGNYYGKNKTATKELFLKRITIICSVIFVVAVIVVNIIPTLI